MVETVNGSVAFNFFAMNICLQNGSNYSPLKNEVKTFKNYCAVKEATFHPA